MDENEFQPSDFEQFSELLGGEPSQESTSTEAVTPEGGELQEAEAEFQAEPQIQEEPAGRYVKANGREIFVPREQEEEYLSKGVSFYEKTRELAEKEKQWEAQLNEANGYKERLSKWDQFDQQLQADPYMQQWFAQNFDQFMQLRGTQGLPPMNVNPMQPQSQSNPEVETLKSKISEMEQFYVNQQIDAELNSLYTKFPDAKQYEAQMFEISGQYGLPLEMSFNMLRGQNVQSQVAQAQKQMVENNYKKQIVSKSVAPATPTNGTEPTTKPKNFKEGTDLFRQLFGGEL